jgi:Flp pilus assembly protein TadD
MQRSGFSFARAAAVFAAGALSLAAALGPARALAGPPVATRDGLEELPMERLQNALRSWESLAQAWFRLKAGDAEGARREVMRLVAERPRDPDAWHVLGVAASAVGRPQQALSALRRSLRLRPDGWVGMHRVNLLLQRGRIGAAHRVVDELDKKVPDDPRVRRARAYVLVAEGDLAGARQVLELLEKSRPSAEVAWQLAVILDHSGDPVAAAVAVRRAVERDPDNGGYRRELFRLLMAAEDWEGLAKASAETGAGVAGGGIASYYRGLALFRLGRNPEAVRALAEVSLHGSPDPLALAGSGGYLIQLGAYDEAERAVRLAMRERDADAHLHHLLAMVLSRQGRESEALAHYRRASEGLPDDATFRLDLLVSLCALSRDEELSEALGRAKKDFAEDPRFGELEKSCVDGAGAGRGAGKDGRAADGKTE